MCHSATGNWKLRGGGPREASRAHRAGTEPGRAAGCPTPPIPPLTFSRVYVARSMISGKCSSYSRMTSFTMSVGGGGSGMGPGLSRGLRAAAPRPVVLQAPGQHSVLQKWSNGTLPGGCGHIRKVRLAEQASRGSWVLTRALDGDLLVVLDHEVFHQLICLEKEECVGRSRPGRPQSERWTTGGRKEADGESRLLTLSCSRVTLRGGKHSMCLEGVWGLGAMMGRGPT